MVNGIVNDQKPVVDTISLLNIDDGILAIVAVHIQFELTGNSFGDNSGVYIGIAFRKCYQHRFIEIIVNQDYPLLRRFDEIGNKNVSVKDLAVVENAFNWRERGANKEIYLLFGFGYPLLQTLNPLVNSITT